MVQKQEIQEVKRKISIEKIRSLNDIIKLKLGNIVEIKDYGRVVYYATSMIGLTFLGRKENSSIYELEAVRGHITPMPDGSLTLGTILSERIYHKDRGRTSQYDDKDMLLRGQGL